MLQKEEDVLSLEDSDSEYFDTALIFLPPGLAARRLHQLITARGPSPAGILLIFGPVASATAIPSTSDTTAVIHLIS
jgi:hypothetical protein